MARPDGAPLGAERLRAVQQALESHERVGSVLSLPVLMAEGQRHPLSFLLTDRWLVSLLDSPLFGRVTRAFLTEDRTRARFVLGMVEHGRERVRVEIVDELEELVARHGLEPRLVGGLYALQGRLAEQVAQSLVTSLVGLGVLFLAIAWLAAGSLRVGLAMTAVVALVPVAVFGSLGLARVPLDIVAAPGVSVGLGLAADALLHVVRAVRRLGDGSAATGLDVWSRARAEQGRGVLRSAGVVAAGFGLFAFSSFPPTQRFGVIVAAATLFAVPLALLVLPALAARREPSG